MPHPPTLKGLRNKNLAHEFLKESQANQRPTALSSTFTPIIFVLLKVTIALKRSSVEFFKAQAAQHNTKYQKMIRELLDRYAEKYRRRQE